MIKKCFLALLIAGLALVFFSCDEDPLCPNSFTNGPYLTFKSAYESQLFVKYSNAEGVGETLRLLPENSINVPMDANSNVSEIHILNMLGTGDTISIAYNAKVNECDNVLFLTMEDVVVTRDTANTQFHYFLSGYDRRYLDEFGNPRAINNDTTWPIDINYEVIIQ